MKFLIVFVALFAVALAAPSEVVIEESNVEVGPESHSYNYKTSDGSEQGQTGHLNNAGSDHEAYVVKGSYSWTDKNGETHEVTYVADENGFQPQGKDIPQA